MKLTAKHNGTPEFRNRVKKGRIKKGMAKKTQKNQRLRARNR